MFVCMCRAVTESEIRDCIRGGARTVEEVGKLSEAGTGCGGCQDSIEMILEDGGVLDLAVARRCHLAQSA
jgi:bacterioferritin-associated ferredoxin